MNCKSGKCRPRRPFPRLGRTDSLLKKSVSKHENPTKLTSEQKKENSK